MRAHIRSSTTTNCKFYAFFCWLCSVFPRTLVFFLAAVRLRKINLIATQWHAKALRIVNGGGGKRTAIYRLSHKTFKMLRVQLCPTFWFLHHRKCSRNIMKKNMINSSDGGSKNRCTEEHKIDWPHKERRCGACLIYIRMSAEEIRTYFCSFWRFSSFDLFVEMSSDGQLHIYFHFYLPVAFLSIPLLHFATIFFYHYCRHFSDHILLLFALL